MARAVVAVAALAVAVSTFVAPPVSAEGVDDSCGTALPAAGAMAGTVDADDPVDWWLVPGVPGRYLVTLTGNAASLTVGDRGCGDLCSGAEALDGVAECLATTNDLGLTVAVSYAGQRLPSAYAVTVVPLGYGATACSDWLDNDGDGFIDNADTGCTGLGDDSEEDATDCPQYRVPTSCVTLEIGPEFDQYTVKAVPHETQEVAAFVDLYEFRVANAPPVPVACVTVLVEPWGDADCAALGGTFVRRKATLFRKPYAHTPLDKPLTVHVCYADLTVTTDGQARTRQIVTECSGLPVD